MLCGSFVRWRIWSLSTPSKWTVQRRLSSSAENDGVGIGLGDGLGVGDGDGVGDGLGDGVGDRVGVGVGVGLGEAVGDGIAWLTGRLEISTTAITATSTRPAAPMIHGVEMRCI